MWVGTLKTRVLKWVNGCARTGGSGSELEPGEFEVSSSRILLKMLFTARQWAILVEQPLRIREPTWMSARADIIHLESTALWKGGGLAFGIMTVLLLGAFAPPFVGDQAGSFFMQAFSHVCHQLSDRSMHIHGESLAICHRCTGAYTGVWIGALLLPLANGWWPFSQKWTAWILAAATAPALIDWSGNVIGLWVNSPVSRVITGAVFGLVAGYILASAFAESFARRSRPKAT